MLLSPKEAELIVDEVDLGPHTLEYALRASQGSENLGCVLILLQIVKNFTQRAKAGSFVQRENLTFPH